MKGKKTNNRQLMYLHQARKLPVTKAPKIHTPKTDYDRRQSKEAIEESLENGRPIQGARKIVVDGKTYFWLYKHSRVIIWSDDGHKHVYYDSEVTGMTPPDVERGKNKKWFSLTPFAVAKWINERKI